MPSFFDTSIEFLKGVGPQKAALIGTELSIFTYGDLIQHYPFRYEDRTKFYPIAQVHGDMPFVQIKGRITRMETIGEGRKKRLVARFSDGTDDMELVWFKGIPWVSKKLKLGVDYVVFGKPAVFGRKVNIAHPEVEILTTQNANAGFLQPVYHTSEKLKAKFIDSKALSKMIRQVMVLAERHIHETLPESFIARFGLINKALALYHIHFPSNPELLKKAQYRLKFEELFYIQLRLLKLKLTRIDKYRGQVFNDSKLLTDFYNDHLPFDLTNAQKRVIKEIYFDMKSGKQMNRLLQGDVGSGKTIVAFICMLLVVGSGAQASMMAPTEILADQHFEGLKEYAEKLGIGIAKLTGSTKTAERKRIHEGLLNNEIQILVGTHALIEDTVQFKNLGLAIIDEQHRFGVAQRAKLWGKNATSYPHVLVMTATPIPRTLAMTLYGDLDVSVIDELPAGRKPIKTIHQYDSKRLQVFGFMKQEIAKGRQIYVVYPLIEESAKLDLKDLDDGYESIRRAFPDNHISIVHGKMKPQDKDFEMQRFIRHETQIMVATTVIEVGVNVPNASVMVIENAERFGLAQLHQLRGRVGRGAEQSYCILMTDFKLSKEARTRLETMVRTNNGFDIADVDLKLRGPGDITGTQQSGVLDLLIADITKDAPILQAARNAASDLLEDDPDLTKPENQNILRHIQSLKKSVVNWGRIS
ncbi:ATP-dependent DNA helicase RecG [Roseivirga pacifica]|uniref:ATP-dependent DNA helicase RecG n=1 Tax=Roseivirga pacifica TaxID=1267423 RepID=UPI00209476B8|nr:ATP-dependent DNA helicase RecG [Roseivirga pacifica]MCO6358882.1 ATP-dependent DNA helicase RecG [Roseivirga pacifica]MCO6365482.1 ATP-dependent DNA helicase RecG [Roseivirga pacifica]MCO6371788.1 ATP-dependent DNA helicase RecG [Roseivirga pacifica]MCO6376101.1 ATP-dependent DNA helicase RecG [Roseivirga pacifica]MCO6379166.1 ATP-dependent DNA helicase RecG [Roseivirga pacifica]